MTIRENLGKFFGTGLSRQAQSEAGDSVLSGAAADVARRDAARRAEFLASEELERVRMLGRQVVQDVRVTIAERTTSHGSATQLPQKDMFGKPSVFSPNFMKDTRKPRR